MRIVSHREMRNQSAELLRRVEAGESVLISNHGRTVAVVMPAAPNTLDDLIERGQARQAVPGAKSRLTSIRRRRSSLTTDSIRDDVRGGR